LYSKKFYVRHLYPLLAEEKLISVVKNFRKVFNNAGNFLTEEMHTSRLSMVVYKMVGQ